MKWMLIVIIANYKGAMVSEKFDMPSKDTCELVSISIEADIKKFTSFEIGGGVDVATTCTLVPRYNY
jgi:hypothetical protein